MLLINPVEGHGWLPEPAVTQAWDLITRRQGGKSGETHSPPCQAVKSGKDSGGRSGNEFTNRILRDKRFKIGVGWLLITYSNVKCEAHVKCVAF